MIRRRLTTCANPECRAKCHPRARGLCDNCLTGYRANHDRARIGTRDRAHYDAHWRRLSKREIAAHIAVHGYTCPRCSRADKQTNRLTLDHVKPRSLEEGTEVLCLKCNAEKGARHG